MSLRSRRFLRLLLPMIAVMCLSAAPQQQLNPTVKVLPAATSTVPPECEEGLAPQPRPRVTPEEKALARQIAAPPELQAPPTNDLRTNLRDLQTAAERNDRATFVDSLARVKTILATYPSGGERSGAEKAVAVYNDINTLWDYQLTSRGAFFDASSDLFKMLSAYAGYDTFIRRQILVDQTGAKFYPSSESRAFLTQVAASRLKDLGIKSAAAPSTAPAEAHKPPVTSAQREKAPTAHETSPKKEATTASVPAPHKKHATASAPKHRRATKEKKPVQVAEAKPAPARKSAEATTVKKTVVTEKAPTTETKKTSETKTASATPATATAEKPATTVTTAPPPATHSVSEIAATATSTTAIPSPAPSPIATSAIPPAPVTASTAGTETTSSATATGTTATETTATNVTATNATVDTAATDTTGTAGEKEQSGRPGEPRNLLWPIILIVVGVGVLILLFRTSPGPK